MIHVVVTVVLCNGRPIVALCFVSPFGMSRSDYMTLYRHQSLSTSTVGSVKIVYLKEYGRLHSL